MYIGNETDNSDDYFVGYRHHHHQYHHSHRPIHHHHKHRHHHHQHHHSQHHQIHSHLPDSIDWRKEGAVNQKVPVQGECGACWAFSVTAAIEGQYFRKTGKLVPLSVQNLVDCSYGLKNKGCHGGFLDEAFKYVKNNGGINTAASYPYEESRGTCRYTPKNSDVTITDFKRIPRGNEEKLQEALATIGPISVSIDASSEKFDFYSSGIYNDPDCRSTSQALDHAVLLVGYGTTEKGEQYYVLKNWYGPNWGERGYFKMSRNQGNHCGIATEPMFPIL